MPTARRTSSRGRRKKRAHASPARRNALFDPNRSEVDGAYDTLRARIERRMRGQVGQVSKDIDSARGSIAWQHKRLSKLDSDDGGVACRRVAAGILDVGYIVFVISFAFVAVWIYHGINADWCDADDDDDCDWSDISALAHVFSVALGSVGSDTDDKIIYQASKIGMAFLHSFAVAIGEWTAFALSACTALFFGVVFVLLGRQGQTVGKFLTGIVTIEPGSGFATAARPYKNIAVRSLASLVLMPVSAVQLVLLHSDETLLDRLTGSSVVSAIDTGAVSWAEIIPAPAVETSPKKKKVKRRKSATSTKTPKKSPAKARSSSRPRKKVAPPAISYKAMTSFTERKFQDLFWVLLYAGATAFLFHGRSFVIPNIPSGHGWWFGLFINTYEFIFESPAMCAKVVATTMAVCIGWIVFGEAILRPAAVYYTVLVIPFLLAVSYCAEIWVIGGGLFNSSHFPSDPISQIMQYILEIGGQLMVVVLLVAYFRAKAASVRVSAAVVNESFRAATANMIIILFVPLLEGMFQVYQLWLIVQVSITLVERAPGYERMSQLQIVHLLWTVCSLRCMAQIVFSNCVGKWYFGAAEPGKFNMLTRSLDAVLSGWTKQLGSAIFSGATMAVIHFLGYLADKVQKQNGKISWFNLPLLPLKIILWTSVMLLNMLTFYLVRLVDAGCAWCGITGAGFMESASYGKAFAAQYADLLLVNGGTINVLLFYLTTPLIISAFAVLTAVLNLSAPEGPSFSGGILFTSNHEKHFAPYFVCFYLCISFAWFLKTCTDAVLICILEDDRHASDMVRSALKDYRNESTWNLSKCLLRIVMIVVVAFLFEQVAQQTHHGSWDFGYADDSLVRAGRVALHVSLIMWASSA